MKIGKPALREARWKSRIISRCDTKRIAPVFEKIVLSLRFTNYSLFNLFFLDNFSSCCVSPYSGTYALLAFGASFISLSGLIRFTVMKNMSSVFCFCVSFLVNSNPRYGTSPKTSPRKGSFLLTSILFSFMRPPINIVSESFIRTCVLAVREEYTGATTPLALSRVSYLKRSLISGEISTTISFL